MASNEPTQVGSITLQELIALNDEIAALVRAGVPLEPALAELGKELPGRLGKLTTMLAECSERGESLPQVMAEHAGGMPPIYRAVVEAGLRSGRLSSALESLAGSIRRLAEMRRAVATAAIYPLSVLILAWVFFALFVKILVPSLTSGFRELEVPGRELFEVMAGWGPSAVYWGPLVPAGVILLAGLWWYGSARAAVAEPRRAARLIGWLPWMGRALQWSRTAAFVELLTLLLENRVPLDEAMVLAADASGDPQWRPAIKNLAAVLRRGETPSKRHLAATGMPPLLRWLISAGQRHDALLPALKHAAETYRRRAEHRAKLARTFLPMVLTITIGGTAVLIYALLLFVPYVGMLRALGMP